MKTVFNVLRVIMAVLLSFFLFGTLVGANVGHSASVFLQKDVIADMFSALDYSEMVKEDVELREELQQSGLDVDAVGELLDSEAMEDLLDIYFEDMFKVIENTGELSTFTPEEIEKIVNEHMEELKPIMDDMLLEMENMDPELMEQQVFDFIEGVAQSLPTTDDLGLTGPNMTSEEMQLLQMLQSLNSGMILIPFVILSILLSLGIVLCRFEKFESFIWLTIVYFFAGGLTLGIGNALSNTIPTITMTTEEFDQVIIPVLQAFGEKMTGGSLVLIAIALTCLAIFIIGRKFLVKKPTDQLMVE